MGARAKLAPLWNMYNGDMQFEVPQFIEIEDKIFGPLTWKQFLFVGGGSMFAIVIFITTNLFVFMLLGVPALIFSAVLAFYPVNNRPFSLFLEAMMSYYSSAKMYRWHRKQKPIYKYKQDQVSPRTPVSPPTPDAKKNINSLARKLELEAMQRNQT